MRYSDFIESKTKISESHGFTVDADSLHPGLFPFQRDIVRWALAKGRAAIFADCGLGKTVMQLVWADQVCKHTEKPVLILAPLAVAAQTASEASRFGLWAKVVESGNDIGAGINITNYEKLDRFDTSGLCR